ncbi:MAG: hypothetical protein ABI874_01720 [Chloroflexota bacterium]
MQKLMDALEQGWRVQSPVYFRKQWHTGHGTRDGYYFIVKRAAETDLIIVPADDKARQLIELQRLTVIAA